MPLFRFIATATLAVGLMWGANASVVFAQCGPNEVLVGEDKDNYYCAEKDEIAKPDKPADPHVPEVANWSGTWEGQEKAAVRSALGGLKDGAVRDWIAAQVRFELRHDPGQQGMVSPWAGNGTLVFNNYFFSKGVTKARRENLIAFEAGKALWLNKVAGNRALQDWFSQYSSDHVSIIRRLAHAKHGGEDLSFIYDDPQETASAFGYVFRAQALGLQLDTATQREFETWIAPLLRGK